MLLKGIQSLMRSKEMQMPKLIALALALAAFRVAAAAPPTSFDEKMIEDFTMPPETRCAP
jgi:hypothetical protein